MAKSKKKKNFKLRRRVKRTIAALTMVMAIVVAAIPVENYGTMQASGVNGANLAKDAEDYINAINPENKHYQPSDYEEKYSGSDTTLTVQHIEGNTFINAYKIQLKSDNSEDAIIIESVFERDLDKFDIYEVEYYDYVQMNADYLKAVENAFDSEKYSIKYTEDSSSKSYVDFSAAGLQRMCFSV